MRNFSNTTDRGLSSTALYRIVAIAILSALLIATGSPTFAQTNYDEKIQSLEKQLEAIKAGKQAGEDVGAKIAALQEEIAKLKQQIVEEGATQQQEAEEPVSATRTDDSSASSQVKRTTESLPPPGVQGSPNPLQRDGNKYLTGDDLLEESFPKSVPIPGTNIRFAIGGYTKLDFIQDLDYVGDRWEFELATIPVEGTPESNLDGRTTVHAKETRINFDFRSVARNEKYNWEFPLQAFLEFDFFDDRDEFRLQPRMRHAYGVVGRLLAGQTWSNTTDVSALAGTIDFSGGDSLYGGRVAQVRWEDHIDKSLKWAIAVEAPRQSIGNPFGPEEFIVHLFRRHPQVFFNQPEVGVVVLHAQDPDRRRGG